MTEVNLQSEFKKKSVLIIDSAEESIQSSLGLQLNHGAMLIKIRFQISDVHIQRTLTFGINWKASVLTDASNRLSKSIQKSDLITLTLCTAQMFKTVVMETYF